MVVKECKSPCISDSDQSIIVHEKKEVLQALDITNTERKLLLFHVR